MAVCIYLLGEPKVGMAFLGLRVGVRVALQCSVQHTLKSLDGPGCKIKTNKRRRGAGRPILLR